MSAANPLGPASSLGGEPRSYEPTMEEILASIRRIIADDQGASSSRPVLSEPAVQPDPPAASLHVLRAEPPFRDEAAAPPESEPTSEVAGASAPMMAAHGHVAAPQFPAPSPASADHAGASNSTSYEPEHAERDGRMSSEAVHAPEPGPALSAEPMHEQEAPIPVARLSESRADQDDGAHAYMQLFSAQTQQSVASAFNALAATRLADNSDELLVIAREMMRPLLKSWLDDNLPTMVERLVRAEIERVARGR